MTTNSSANAKTAGTGLANPYAYLLPTQPTAEGATPNDAGMKSQTEEKKSTVSAFHNPHLIKRPQSKAVKPAKKPTARPMIPLSSSDAPTATSTQQKPKLSDFLSTAEEDAAIDAQRREENKRRNMQKKEFKKAKKKYGDWYHDDPYKLKYPTKMDIYRKSHEENMWNDCKAAFTDFLLEARGQDRRLNANSSSSASPSRSYSRSTSPVAPNRIFAPPSFDDPTEPSSVPAVDLPQTVEEMLARRAQLAESRGVAIVSPPRSPSPPTAAPEALMETSAEEGVENTTASPLSRNPSSSPEPNPETEESSAKNVGLQSRLDEIRAKVAAAAIRAKAIKEASAVPPPPSSDSSTAPPPPPPPSSTPPPPPPPQMPYNPTISADPVHYARPPPIEQAPYNPTISAAPVHYARPSPPADQTAIQGPQKDKNSKKRKGGASAEEPPKESKAAKMMAKMGWKKGEGLGKDSDGITSALTVKAGKNMGSDKVIASVTGGVRTQTSDPGRFGEPSKVVVSWGCVDGIDFDADADREDGGIRQEMGDTFNRKFGEVERIYIGPASLSTPVYIKFNNEMSALNAVNRFFEGYEFRGRSIRAEFYDEKKFNASIYEH